MINIPSGKRLRESGWRKAETNPNTGAYVLSATVIGALAGARF